MTLDQAAVGRIIERLIGNGNYRTEIVTIINAIFLEDAVKFFKKIAVEKIEGQRISPDSDWYRGMLTASSMDKDDIATRAGLNIKTISNIYGTARREIVIDASLEHYANMLALIDGLIADTEGEDGKELDLSLKIEFNKVSVELTLSETLLVVNALAVKRAALRGGMWSTAGKRAEKPLMVTLCHLFGVSDKHYRVTALNQEQDSSFRREIDFYLVDGESGEEYKCEVKLIGQGNPESADAVIARDSRVFIADKLSQTNRNQLTSLGVEWVELNEKNGFMRFGQVLRKLRIPHTPLSTPPSQQAINAAIAESLR